MGKRKIMIALELLDVADLKNPDVHIKATYNPKRKLLALDLDDVIKKSNPAPKVM